MIPPWTIGLEIELLAPPGRTRRDLAEAYAALQGAEVIPTFHLDSEPSKVPGKPIFHNLTPAFEVRRDGELLLRIADDLTLQDDLRRAAPPQPGWYRIVSDDPRLLRLIQRHCDAADPLHTVLDPAAALFGSTVEIAQGQIYRLADPWHAPIALAAPLPGERERPAEVITPPLQHHLEAVLRQVLKLATDLGFTPAQESALHIHVDATPFNDAATLRRLVHLVHGREADLRRLVGTNPRCRRLGPWPESLRAAVDAPGFAELPWPEARARLAGLQLSKYVDLNLKNLVHPVPGKHTLEWRVLPVHLDPERVLAFVRLLTAILRRAQDPTGPAIPAPADADLSAWLAALPLSAADHHTWSHA